jgi:nicotinate phosphoribosyltransferase
VHPTRPDLGLFTDLYQLTMLQAYLDEGMTESAVFSLFVRRLPAQRTFLLACGLETVLQQLEELHFTEDDCAYLASLRLFSEGLLDWLRGFRFSGDVFAVPEGTPVFANEPILEIVAPLPEAQLIETLVMNQIHLQTLLASKAARVVAAAAGRTVIDFGTRRAHGIDAAVCGARAFHIAGVDATSNVLAGKRHGIPVSGTMAHSYIQAHGDEREAFRAFAGRFPGTVLLVDTYDTLGGVRRVIDLATTAVTPITIRAIRLDSGDLAALARESRRLLDDAGLRHVQIIASSGLDEHDVATLLASGAPIDGFGVGTAMSVSSDAPSLDIVYKLAEYAGEGRTKLSAAKPVLPGQKQVFRHETDGRASRDVIARWGEALAGRPLLKRVMRGGRRMTTGPDDLRAIREHTKRELATLPGSLSVSGEPSPGYRVDVSAALERYHSEVVRRTAAGRP